jgi:hypothetical protein
VWTGPDVSLGSGQVGISVEKAAGNTDRLEVDRARLATTVGDGRVE